MLGRVEVTGTPLPHSFSQDVGLTSAISILPSEFLSYFCMNSFIFSPKLSLFDIWGKTKGWGLTVLPGPTGTTDLSPAWCGSGMERSMPQICRPRTGPGRRSDWSGPHSFPRIFFSRSLQVQAISPLRLGHMGTYTPIPCNLCNQTCPSAFEMGLNHSFVRRARTYSHHSD